MFEPNQPHIGKRRRGDTAFVCGLVVLWGFAHWKLLSTLVWGATICHGGRRFHRTDCRFETDLEILWPELLPWFFLGPFFLVGTLVFLWIQRSDRA